MNAAAIVWAGFAVALSVGLVVIVRTRWLQSRTLEKCVALSAGLHAALALICGFVGGWSPRSVGLLDEGPMTMVLAVSEVGPDESSTEAIGAGDTARDASPDLPPPLVPLPPSADAPVSPPEDHVPLLATAGDEQASEVEPPPSTVAAATDGEGEDPVEVTPRPHAIPAVYADRSAGRRAAAAQERGGSEATERAVGAALRWLVESQEADGRWHAARHGAGIERTAEGRERRGVGGRTDHGVTGLALLALLGAGNTHRDGPHAEAVARGLRFLQGRQRPDGSLAGEAEFFAALYCHGMATIAVSECLALTGDQALAATVERAVAHTLALQHPHTGGWRYAAGDRGDTSQCGWQVMVLATARQAGLRGFEAAEARARLFLQSVSSGTAGGLAAYRPGERPSMAMTAEALYCRLVLGATATDAATTEALTMIAGSPPTRSTANAYAWYYATLAAFHAGGPQWDRWNARLHEALLPMQQADGSWDPDPVWGGHGGRVYSTALSAMTLEVYYRHQPIHLRGQRLAANPAETVAP